MPPYVSISLSQATYWEKATDRVTFSTVRDHITSPDLMLFGRKGMNVSAQDASLSSASKNERHLPPIPSHSWRSIPEVTSALKRMIPFRLHNKQWGVQFHDSGLRLDRKTLHRLSVAYFISFYRKNIQLCNSQSVSQGANMNLIMQELELNCVKQRLTFL